MKLVQSFQRKSKAEVALYCFVSFIFFLVAFSYVYLLLWAAIAGLKTHIEIVMNPFGLPKVWNWGHYLDVFNLLKVNGNTFWDMLGNSVYFSVGGQLLQQYLVMSFAYCCTRYKFPGSKLPYTIILIMMTLPLYGASGAMYRLIKDLGWMNSRLQVLCALGGCFSINFLYYRAYFINMSSTYAEAAMIDGAGDWRIYFNIVIPMTKPLFGALFLTSWVADWTSYESALIYLPKMPTLPVGIYQFNTEMIYRARLDILFAACVLVSLPCIILFTVFNKTLTTSVSLGGIKG
jgi:ABC-type glycerol-3-phosphate transport system permease component